MLLLLDRSMDDKHVGFLQHRGASTKSISLKNIVLFSLTFLLYFVAQVANGSFFLY